jgi:photosystem II stability/assembly factor-like uncharacterized protein
MKSLFTLISLFIFIQFTYTQTAWFRLFTDQGTTYYTGIQFFGAEKGYVSYRFGDAHSNGGGVIKTTNGGMNWIAVISGVNKYGLYFLSEQTGWVIGGYWDDAGTISREVFRTTNGGINFNRLYIDSLQTFFQKIFFSDLNTGWIMTYNKLYRTTNSGVNWTECAQLYLNSFYFINANTGWGSSSAGTLYKTTNGGLNWNTYFVTPSSFLGEVYFIDNNTGWVCSSSPYIYKSTNSGINWTAYGTCISDWTSSIEFYNYSRGWASSDSGKIIMTTNGGINWTLRSTGEVHDLYLLCFPTADTGFVFGNKFLTPYSNEWILLKTTNGGLIGFHGTSTEIPISFELHQNYPNPFNPSTKIRFDIPVSPLSSLPASVWERGAGGFVTLIIYDILGREVATLVNEQLKLGTYEVEWDGTSYPSGVYFYKLTTETFNQTKRMVLIK